MVELRVVIGELVGLQFAKDIEEVMIIRRDFGVERVKLSLGEAISRDINIGALERSIVGGLDVDDTCLGVLHS